LDTRKTQFDECVGWQSQWPRILGTPTDAIAKALTSLRELKEGFHQIKTDKLVYIDDYAHHPTEIDAAPSGG
jgi:UDP-N-acetylmuramate-alanine ligase